MNRGVSIRKFRTMPFVKESNDITRVCKMPLQALQIRFFVFFSQIKQLSIVISVHCFFFFWRRNFFKLERQEEFTTTLAVLQHSYPSGGGASLIAFSQS